MRVNVVNVCTPSDGAKAEMKAALARIPQKPGFNSDYEVARGHSTDNQGPSDWVRLRREFAGNGGFSNVQFLASVAEDGVVEKIVFHLKAAKSGEPMQISLEHEDASGNPEEALSHGAAPNRIRIERFGEGSLILARCPQADQSSYEELFTTAAAEFTRYQQALKVRETAASELSRLKPQKKAEHH